MRRRAFGFLLAVAPLVFTGCVPQGLAFRQDTRLEITSPEDGAEVILPVTLTWTMRDFEIKSKSAPDGGFFAVFLDRPPVPPGEPLSWVARDDAGCQEQPRCPNARYLAQQGIYETTKKRLKLTTLPEAERSVSGAERHYATIILLDAEGERIGEIAYVVAFEVTGGTES